MESTSTDWNGVQEKAPIKFKLSSVLWLPHGNNEFIVIESIPVS